MWGGSNLCKKKKQFSFLNLNSVVLAFIYFIKAVYHKMDEDLILDSRNLISKLNQRTEEPS